MYLCHAWVVSLKTTSKGSTVNFLQNRSLAVLPRYRNTGAHRVQWVYGVHNACFRACPWKSSAPTAVESRCVVVPDTTWYCAAFVAVRSCRARRNGWIESPHRTADPGLIERRHTASGGEVEAVLAPAVPVRFVDLDQCRLFLLPRRWIHPSVVLAQDLRHWYVTLQCACNVRMRLTASLLSGSACHECTHSPVGVNRARDLRWGGGL